MSARLPIVTKRRLRRARRWRAHRVHLDRIAALVIAAVQHDYLGDTFIADRVCPVVGEDTPHDPNDPRWAPVPGEHPAKARMRAMMRGDGS